MTSNLQEFLAMAMLVTSATTFVAGFRYAIIMWERSAAKEIKLRQPEWDALAHRMKNSQSKNKNS